MTDSKDELEGPPLDQTLNSAKDFADKGNYAESLKIYEELFKRGVAEFALYDSASQTLVSAIIDGHPIASRDGWGEARLIAFLRPLILEVGRSGTPPALAARIAGAHSSGITTALEKITSALRPALSAMLEEGCREQGLLILVLLLRSELADWEQKAAISQWHIDLLPTLDQHELTIPYNSMFDSVHFRRNVEDVRVLVERTDPGELVRRFPAWQLLRFMWITGSEDYEKQLPAMLAAYRRAFPGGPDTEDDCSANRSLTLRWAARLEGPSAAQALTPALGEELAGLVIPWLSLRGSAEHRPAAEQLAYRIQSPPRQAGHYLLDLVGRNAPFLKLGRRRPRLAVCISGQLRGYRAALPSWRAGWLRDTECHFVVHSWEKVGRSGAEPFRAYLPFAGRNFCDAWRVQAGRAGMAVMHERFPALISALQQGGVVTRSELSAFYETDHVELEDDTSPRFAGWSNSRKMHYKISAANDLLDQLDKDVDLVIRIRPDKAMGAKAFGWSSIRKVCNTTPTLFADAPLGHQFGRLMIGDQVALASRQVMSTYANTLNLVPRFNEARLYSCPPDYVGHCSLALTCWHAGIDVHRLPVRMGSLLEAEPMQSVDIEAALNQDAVGRFDAVDQYLLTAVRSDVLAGT